MITIPECSYCIEIDYQKESTRPSRVFQTLYELIETFQQVDQDLIHVVHSQIEPVLLLENIETGSIKTWLTTLLQAIDDDAIKNIDWKPALGKYLVKAKYYMIRFMEHKTAISSYQEVKQLEGEIYDAAKETNIRMIPIYDRIPTKKLLKGMQNIASNITHLQPHDKAAYITPEDTAHFNLNFNFAPESIEELLTKESLTADNEMILKVKKPDYLGESKWEFRHGGRSFEAKILHNDWLESFQNRQLDIRPGDSLRALVRTVNKYAFDGELLASHYSVLEVKEILQLHTVQTEMFAKE